MKKLASIIVAIIALFLAVAPAMADYGKYNTDLLNPTWVNTPDGKNLNVRKTPGGDVLCRLTPGTMAYILDFHGDWAEIVLKNGKTGFVMTKFLQEGKPGKYELTEREDNFKALDETFFVTAKAVNKKNDKSVGLRVKPTKSSKAIRTLKAGDELEVIAEGKTWLQVQDPATGKTGFVARDYMERI